jgi:GNAT superfamily N-acetyltransferase
MEQRPIRGTFLEEDATLEQRWRALRSNIETYYEREAMVRGEDFVVEDGMTWTEQHMTISSVHTMQVGEQIDNVLEWYRGRDSFGGAICWYLNAGSPEGLAAQLYARGFSPNWQPLWMWCELQDVQSYVVPEHITMRVVREEAAWQVEDLPYYKPEETVRLAELQRRYPQNVWLLAAWQGEQVVGRCIVHMTKGEDGIAGLFNMGVVPAVRKQGIGTALVQEACALVRRMGCRHMMLNATPMGEPVYRRVGFQTMGYGYTWHLGKKAIRMTSPKRGWVMFLEAVGHGDVAMMERIGRKINEKAFHKKTAGGLRALDIAVQCHQPQAAEWLVEHGVQLDLISAWDLRWKERVKDLLAKSPEMVNEQRGKEGVTPLHMAVERGDSELVKILLKVTHDLTIEDKVFHSTALGWARYFGREEIVGLIEGHIEEYKDFI